MKRTSSLAHKTAWTRSISVMILLGLALGLSGALDPLAHASEPMSICDAVLELRYEKAFQLATQILESDKAGVPDKVGAYRCQACAFVGQRKMEPAKQSIGSMLELDPSARFSPDLEYPPTVINLYHAVRDSLYPGTTDIRTVAIGDFEDNSIYTGKFKDYDFSLFGRAMVHTIGADLAEATDLKIVDRQRIDQILSELELSQSGFANPQEAVRVGELLGAQTFIFGQYMILSKKTVRIDARVVHTASGEIILTKQVTGEFAGDPMKFLELEKSLVLGLTEGIDSILAGGGSEGDTQDRATEYYAQKQVSLAKAKSDYVESKFLCAEALEFEDQGDFQSAQVSWQKVLEADPVNNMAANRLRVIDSILKS